MALIVLKCPKRCFENLKLTSSTIVNHVSFQILIILIASNTSDPKSVSLSPNIWALAWRDTNHRPVLLHLFILSFRELLHIQIPWFLSCWINENRFCYNLSTKVANEILALFQMCLLRYTVSRTLIGSLCFNEKITPCHHSRRV